MQDAIRRAEFQRRQRATVVVGTALLVMVLIFLVWATLRLGEWPLVTLLCGVSIAVGGMVLVARRGHVRLAGYAFSLLAIFGVVAGVMVRGNPGFAPFFIIMGVVLAAVTLEPRDVLVLLGLSLAGSAVIAWWPKSTEQVDTVGGIYAEGLLLFLVVGFVAYATSVSVARLVGELARRDLEAREAHARADQLAQKLQHSQRMEALGRLAGGIAHDFNNLLAVMQPCVESLADALPGERGKEDLRDLSSAVGRGAALTRQLLAFSRRDVVVVSRLDLRAVVEGMRDLLRRLLGGSVEVVLVLGDTPCPLRGSPSQLEQVLMNLAVNARDAMNGQGTIRLEVARCEDPALGAAACLSVADTGPGMSEDVRSRIFEPFFTTKPQGQGTGLGLATVYGITVALGGRVEVDSAPGRGTTFRVLIPLASGGEEAPSAAPPEVARAPAEVRVHVVDDAPGVRQQMVRILTGAGFNVRDYGSAEELLADTAAGAPDVLVADVNLPGLSGAGLAEQLLGRSPQLRVVLVSGFAPDPEGAARLISRGAQFLEKPFAPATLVGAVNPGAGGRRTG